MVVMSLRERGLSTRAVEKIMDGGKQQPQLFRADLFSSPPSGLSLGLGDEAFSSPLSLAPALGTAATGSPSSKCALIGTIPILLQAVPYASGALWVTLLHVSNSKNSFTQLGEMEL